MSAQHWFDIPVSDFDRALNFYQTVMAAQLYVNDQPKQWAACSASSRMKAALGAA